jgi:flavorubredoxin
MTVELTPDVQWINECYAHNDHHEHVSVYLIESESGYILIDSGSFYHREAIATAIEAETKGEGLDALILSHSDYPHSGNVSNFRSEWGDVELIASSAAPEVQGLSTATQCEVGGGMEILGRNFHFIDPPLADRSHTTWIYEADSKILFTADGMGSYHELGQCDAISSDLADGIDPVDIREFHEETLVWLRYVEPEKLRAAVESVLDQFEVSFIAPAHGTPITADDLEEYVDNLIDAAAMISAEYTVPETS